MINQSGYGTIANAEVLDAEIHDAMAALETIRESNRAIYSLLDNTAAFESLITG